MRTKHIIITSAAIILSLCWVLTTITPAFAKASVTAEVDRTTIAPGESVQLDVTISGGDGEVDASVVQDFKVLSQGSSSSIQIINGQMTREMTYSYLLIPKRQGKLTIPALPVEVDGEVHHSIPITITVDDQPAENNPEVKGTEVLVEAELSEKAPYEGQQITYTFRMLRRVRIDEATFQPPKFEGFSVKEIQDRHTISKIINGRQFKGIEVYYVLTPLSAGPVTIEPAELQVGIVKQDRNRRRSPFDSFFDRGVMERYVLQTKAMELKVQPLPPVPANLKYSGLVGQFDLKTQLEAKDLKVGDSATLAITIEGRGNIMDAKAPELSVPAAFKAYVDTPQEKVDLDKTGFYGNKVFRTALVPLEAGNFELTPVTLTYFDVTQKDYRTLTASPPPLTVAAAQNKTREPVAVTPPPAATLKKKVAFTGRDILPLKENLSAIESTTSLSWPFFLIGLLVPVLLFSGFLWIQYLRRSDTSPTAVMKARSHQALKLARKSTDEAFLTPLYQALTAAILTAGGRTGEALTWKEAELLLLQSGCSSDTASRAAKLLSEIESCKFSGQRPTPQQRKALMDQTLKMVRKLLP